MTELVKDPSFDSTMTFFKKGYAFISEKCRDLKTDAFETRLFLQKVVCAYGEEAARMFYEPGRFTRKMAIPPSTLLLLQGPGSVQTLDGTSHQLRKKMFLKILNRGSVQKLVETFISTWNQRACLWEHQKEIVFQDEMELILCQAVCEWSGLSLESHEVVQRTREFAAMVEGAASLGPRNWKALIQRKQNEHWVAQQIEQYREGKRKAPSGSALEQVARFQDQNHRLLEPKLAAIELINILRPTVAVSRFVTFAALALYEHPESRMSLKNGSDGEADRFLQEVRRFYPFFPAVGGRVEIEFTWRGRRFQKGDLVLLDLYGTNHDSRIWKDPYHFRPERFLETEVNDFNLIPQGGGHVSTGHRCAGEEVTRLLLKEALRFLCHRLTYEVPEQNLQIDLSRIPAIPASRFIVRNVKLHSDRLDLRPSKTHLDPRSDFSIRQ